MPLATIRSPTLPPHAPLPPHANSLPHPLRLSPTQVYRKPAPDEPHPDNRVSLPVGLHVGEGLSLGTVLSLRSCRGYPPRAPRRVNYARAQYR
jgi:hypothetical protein